MTAEESCRLILIAQAGPPARESGRFPSDQHADGTALKRAVAMAGRLQRADRVWCAPSHAALATAAALGLSPDPEPALRDVDYGAWSGMELMAVRAAHPAALAGWLAEVEAAPPEGEAATAVIGRIGAWIDQASSLCGTNIAIATPSVIRAAIVHALGAPHACWFRLEVGFLSRSVLTRSGAHWRVAACNAPL